MAFTPTGPYVDSPPSATTPVLAASINLWEATLEELSASVGLPARRFLTGSGDETAEFQDWIDAAVASGEIMVGDATLTIHISDVIDMRAHGLRYIGNGMAIINTGTNKGCLKIGGYEQVVTGVTTDYQTQPLSTHTASIGVEFYAGFECYYADFHVYRACVNYALGQSDWDGTGQNNVFSCTLQNIFALGWSKRAMDMRSWPAGATASTGNVMTNVYLHNNYSGVAVSADTPIVFQDWDESHFEQWNLEWCDLNGNDVWFFQRCRNFALTSIHFEGLTIAGTAGLFRPYENCILTIRNVTWTNSPLVADGGRKSVVRLSEPNAAPMYVHIDGLRVRSLSGTATAVCLVDLLSDANALYSRVTIDNYSTIDGELIGEAVVGDNAYSPIVQQINDTFYGVRASDTNRLYRAQSSMPRDAVQGTAAGTMTSGIARFAFFTAEESRAYTQLRTVSSTTAAGATPSLVRLGLYTVDAAGAMTLVARTASQTGALAAVGTAYTYAMATAGGFPASYTLVTGQRYALAQIVVTAAAAPTVTGQSFPVVSESAQTPMICGSLSGQSDLPTSTAIGSLTASSTRAYMVLLP